MTKIDGVVGCGRHDNILHVLIDEDGDVDKTRREIEQELRGYSFSNELVSRNIKYFQFPGARITLPKPKENKSYGTLGGFLTVDHDQSTNVTKLYAVTAGHVSLGSEGKMTSEDQVLGHYLGEWKNGEDADIIVGKILEEHMQKCDLKLRDDKGNPLKCLLLDLERVSNSSVPELTHIKGASSDISLGEIQTVMFRISDKPENYMLLQNRRTRFEQSPFCKPGDSGAIVCSNDRSGNFVNVLGTVIGKFESKEEKYDGNRYLALHIQSGLNHLKQKYQLQFKLCEEYIE